MGGCGCTLQSFKKARPLALGLYIHQQKKEVFRLSYIYIYTYIIDIYINKVLLGVCLGQVGTWRPAGEPGASGPCWPGAACDQNNAFVPYMVHGDVHSDLAFIS